MRNVDQVQSWRAIEALRSGVPNRDAVQALGSSQHAIEERFTNQLAATEDGLRQGRQARGTLIAGDFGSGKSHLLEYLQHMALQSNFVCSKVVISKETPLYDPAKVYKAAIQSARVADRAGEALVAVSQRLGGFQGSDHSEYDDFRRWVERPESGLSRWFPATVFVFERTRDLEVRDRIVQFWAGGRLTKGELSRWLKGLGEVATYRLDKAGARELAAQRYLFAPRLMAAAGYAGWVILLDEVELIGRYSLQQRARSYAQMARFLGRLEGDGLPGLSTVMTIAGDFESAVLDARNDEERIRARLDASHREGDDLLAGQAERGMRLIRQERMLLEPLSEASIQTIYDKIRSIYDHAYDWAAPYNFGRPDRTARLRHHIKRWINEFDLERLYPGYQPDTEVSETRQDYTESPELQSPLEEDDDPV